MCLSIPGRGPESGDSVGVQTAWWAAAKGGESSMALDQDLSSALLESLEDGVVITDLEGRILDVNGQWCEVIGLGRDELIGTHPPYPWWPDEEIHVEERRALLDALESRKQATGERVVRNAMGALLPMLVSLSPLRDSTGNTRGHLLVYRDTTEQKRSERRLQAQNDELAAIRQAVDISVDAIISVDGDQRITLFNTGAEDIFAYTASEVLGTPLEQLIPERYRGPHAGYVASFRDGDVVARRMDERREIFGRRKDGSEFPAEASISRRVTDDGATLTVILRDITQRKRFEESLSEKNIALAKAIQAKDTFLANMSHELRTPLNSIIGFTGTLLMKLPGPLNAEQEQQLRIVQSSGRHLLSIINDLLDLAKIESGKVEVSLGPVDCADVIKDVVRSLSPLAADKGVPLRVEAIESPVVAWSDPRALGQIVINLVNNAVKFTEAGEVRVVVAEEGSEIAIHVIDTGPGISTDDQERIFDAFERTTSSIEHSVEGTGLGLHICMKLAELIGARLEVSSPPGDGATFTVLLTSSDDR